MVQSPARGRGRIDIADLFDSVGARFTCDSPTLMRVFEMPQGKEVFLGLNQSGVIVFFVAGLLCFPLGFIVPFFIDSMKSDPNAK